MSEKLRVLITFALEPELVEQIRAVDPERIEIDVLGQDQRRLLRGFRYPSEREREAVAEGLHGAFERAEVVFGFWGGELAAALRDASKAPAERRGGQAVAEGSGAAAEVGAADERGGGPAAEQRVHRGWGDGDDGERAARDADRGIHHRVDPDVREGRAEGDAGADEARVDALRAERAVREDGGDRRGGEHRRGGGTAGEGVRMPGAGDDALGYGAGQRGARGRHRAGVGAGVAAGRERLRGDQRAADAGDAGNDRGARSCGR